MTDKITKRAKALEGQIIPLESAHDPLHDRLCEWLGQHTGMRAPGVKDNLFRLSDYLSRKADVPPREVLLFLHAYIFALEHTTFYQGEEIKRLKKSHPVECRKALTKLANK